MVDQVQPVGAEFLVNTATSGIQFDSQIAALTGGGFVVSWRDSSGEGGDASSGGIKAQLYDASGARVGGEFLVNTTTLDSQQSPTITGLTNGGFVVSWSDFSGLDGDASLGGTKAQLYDANGAQVGGEFLVNTATSGSQADSKVTGLADGGFVISWADYSGEGGDADWPSIKAQLYDATGTKVGDEFLVNTATSGIQFDPQSLFERPSAARPHLLLM